MKLCRYVLIGNINSKSVQTWAILMLFVNKRLTKCQKVAKYQQHLVKRMSFNQKASQNNFNEW